MTRRRMVGPRSDGDFAMSIGMGGGRIKRRTRLTPKAEKELKKKSTKQGRKLQKKKTQEPVYDLHEKGLRSFSNKTKANIDPVNKKLTKTLRKNQEKQAFKKAADDHHKSVKRLHTDKKFATDTLTNEVSNILLGGKRGEMHPATWRDNMRRAEKELTNEVKKEKKQLKKSIHKRKRTRQLTEDAKRRRN